MRTNNSKVKNTIISVYFILIVFAILLATVFSAFKDLTNNSTLTFFIVAVSFAFVIVIVHYISRYFEYDSDGVKVVVINRGLLLSEKYNYREHKLEFEKEKLVSFKIHNYIIFKSLVLHVRDSRGHRRKETFNVTLVTRKKRKYIKQSLSKMIKTNRKTS